MQQILIIKVSSLGDIVHTLPVVADIHRYHPNAQIDWLAEEGFVDLVQLVKGIRRVIPLALRRWRKQLFSQLTWKEIGKFRHSLKREHYDAVIDCQGLIKTAWVGRFARGPMIGLNNRTDGASYEALVRFFYHRCISVAPRTHVVERSRQLVAAALRNPPPNTEADEIDFGLDTQSAAAALADTGFNLNLAMQPQPITPYVVFVHATSRADKQWPQRDWIALGQTLIQRGIAIVLPWGSDAERMTSENIAKACGTTAFVPPALTLPAIVGLIDRAAATVGVDTGLVHIAAALKRPTVQLYHFDTAWRTGGYWSPNIIHLGGKVRPAQLDEVKNALAGFGLL